MARPREFDPADALGNIKQVFWRKGYEGTSLQHIEAATGLNKQSLYRVFGDKQGMYRAALKSYEEEEVAAGRSVLLAGTDARSRFAQFFAQVIDAALSTGDRRGCFLCHAAIDLPQLDPETSAQVTAATARLLAIFEEGLRVSDSYARDAARCRAKATHLLASYHGLRVLIKAGMEEAALRAAAEDIVSAI